MEERTDEALLASHIAGEDADSFEELLGRYVNELIPFLTRLTGSKAAADDVFQETFLQIHQSARTFDPHVAFVPGLHHRGEQGTRLAPQERPAKGRVAFKDRRRRR